MTADEPKAPPHSVSLDEAAKLLGVSRRTVYNQIRAGQLQTMQAGTSQRVLWASLPDWAAGR